MSGGATAAVIIAAHQRAIGRVIDAFRVAGATAPERSQTLDRLGLTRNTAVRDLERAGVIRPGASSGSWYLDEQAYVTRRESRSRRARIGVTIALISVFVLLAVAIMLLEQTNR